MIFVKNRQPVGGNDGLFGIRRNNQNIVIGLFTADDVNQRKHIRGCFAAAARCNSENVLALQNRRDYVALYGCRFFDAKLVNCLNSLFAQS